MTSRHLLLAVLLCACSPTPLEYRAVRDCVETDRAGENAAIIACIAAGQRQADDDAEELAIACKYAMRGSLCQRWEWFVEAKERGESDYHYKRLYLCERALGAERSLCRDHGWVSP